jgi:hypothetical protein
LFKLGVLASTTLLALSARATLQGGNDDRQDHDRNRPDRDWRHRDDDENRRGHHPIMRLATGQFVTPTAIRGSEQQYLNPGLPAYMNFIAGEAVRSQLSPDGTTLAVLTAGQNSLYRPDGTVDVPNSTQYLFLYDVVGANKAKPVLLQAIKQVNAHVGLVFSPDGNTIYAAGGNDDAVYVYTKSGGGFAAAAPIRLGHYPPGAIGSARNKGIGLGVQPNASGLDISADGNTLVVANNYNDSISVIDTTMRVVRYEHDLRPYFVNNENRSGRPGGTFPFAVVMKGNDTAYVSSDRDREVIVVDVLHRRPSDQTHQAGRQRARDDSQCLAVQALCGSGQRRPGRGDRHVVQQGDRQDRCARAVRPAPGREAHGRGHVGRDAVARRHHVVRGQQRIELHRRHPGDGPQSA